VNFKQELSDSLNLDLNDCQFTSCSGGSINQSFKLETSDQRYFVKHLPTAKDDFFAAEADGLSYLKKHSSLKIPEVIDVAPSYLCLEWIEPNTPHGDFFEDFGRALAAQHKLSAPSWGFQRHNYIGSLPQKNSPEDCFVDFFWEHRLLEQIHRCQILDNKHLKLFGQLEKKLDQLLDTPDEKPALLHGDLWSGNFLCDENNQAVLIDPAVAYSHREMELAFTEMFGGFNASFYTAYNEAFPLHPGYAERKDIYNLYPLMVHVNLFGASYLGQVESILSRF
jgi:protein-ribulosamine 3-kinase